MSLKPNIQNNPFHDLDGPNLGYIHEQYEHFLQNPENVDPDLAELFKTWGEPPLFRARTEPVMEMGKAGDQPGQFHFMKKAVSAAELVQQIRIYGHLAAKINSFLDDDQLDTHHLEPSAFGLSEKDLREIPAEIIWPESPAHIQTGWDVVRHLREVYTGTTAFQFTHLHVEEERDWLNRMVETGAFKRNLSAEERLSLLKNLTEVEEFENFLHRSFAGQKRFSIEGLDMLVPLVDQLILQGAHVGTRTVLIGMAHRGRLNVLAHILEKPYEKIFSEFYHSPNPELFPSEGSMGISHGWTGDVKYHLGADRDLEIEHSAHVRLVLANNPSHLEFVDAVVEGYARAAQEERTAPGLPEQDINSAFAILVHGDAAFPGEGIVAETINLSRLRGFHTGGTIHIIANNQIGFTTNKVDSRSTKYASDLAKGFSIPIVHVNADDPEACLQAAILAFEYRKKFHKDFLIDLVGFRRHGHNETDDPAVTQPVFYQKVAKHPGVRSLYAEELRNQGILKDDDDKRLKEEVLDRLKVSLERAKSHELQPEPVVPEAGTREISNIRTMVPAQTLKKVNEQLLQWPSGFTIYPKLDKILQRRMDAFAEGGKVDWGTAETLAFATILMDGTSIRLTGQDTERGTFAHRHLVLHDSKTGEPYIPLHHLPEAKASFAVYNSALSETAVMGFEYGYDVFAKDTLVLWEAQFGDFVNVAQVMIDTFLSAGRAKWGQDSNLVLLLPHGYEGQGPEHSSARPERFLQLAAEGNMMIVNPTSAAQYFHVLRRQKALVGTGERRPLIIFTPKGLLRNPRAASGIHELAEGSFQPIIEQEKGLQSAERLVLCSGKIAVELEAEWEKAGRAREGTQIVRVEQLYPFPEKELLSVLQGVRGLRQILWVQEEPQNMGAWSYMEPRLRNLTQIPVTYVGRPVRSSTAEGLPDVHKVEQQRIIHEALYAAEREGKMWSR